MINPAARAALTNALKYKQRDLTLASRNLADLTTAVEDETENVARLANEVRDLEAALA